MANPTDVKWYLCGVGLHFPDDLVMLSIFSYVCWHWYVIFGKKCLFCPSINFLIKSCVLGFFDVELHKFYVYLDINPLSDI